MKTVFDVVRHPLVIGALVLSILIVVGVYFGSHWYYGDVERIDMPEVSAPTPYLPRNLSSSEIDLSGLQGESLLTQPESTGTVSSAEGESVDDFLAELSDEEKALLTAEVVEETQRVSLFGFGPYPEVPSDFPHSDIWDSVEREAARDPEMAENLELLARVRIKLWNDGKPTLGASIDPSSGLVYPNYPNTVYVEWAEFVREDGGVERYAGRMRGAPWPSEFNEDYFAKGLIPPGITVIEYSAGGIAPHQFLNLP